MLETITQLIPAVMIQMQQRETLQDRVYKAILVGIYEGEFPVNSSLPTLKALTQQYQVGDKCIRAVVRRLKEDGYLSTLRGRPARIIFKPNQWEAQKRLFPDASCDKKKLAAFYEAILILFPSIYTHASMTCTQAQLTELSLIIPQLPGSEDSSGSYIDLNIRFFNAILPAIDNTLVLHIVRTVLQNTMLPTALVQGESDQLKGEFLQSSVTMGRIYKAVLANDPACVKEQWVQLFKIAEGMAKKAVVNYQDIPSHPHKEQAGLQNASEYKYLLIAHDLCEKILEGKYPLNTFLPTIVEAQQIYDSAKITIQTAYRVLSDLGIIKTIHGRGSLVIRLVLSSDLPLDENVIKAGNRDYLETVEFLQIVCGDIISHSRNHSLPALKDHLTGELNPSHRYSGLILCRYLMKESNIPALDAFYQVISRSLYWGSYESDVAGGMTLEEKHHWCLAIVHALEHAQTQEAITLTRDLLTALYDHARKSESKK